MKLSVFLFLVSVASLHADPVIKFDDLPSNGLPVPPGYHGLFWTNFYYLNGESYGNNPSGFKAGVVSSNDVIYGGGTNTATITAGMFDFLSAYATSAWNDNLKFEARGYIKGTLVYDVTNTLSATSSQLVNFNFYGVDQVDLTSSGGTLHSGYLGGSPVFALDNVTVTTYVPYAPPLITNGGFETASLTNWIHGGNTNETFVTTASSYVHSGSDGVQTGPTVTPGFLYQNAGATVIGQNYLLSCWLENFNAGANDFAIYWGPFSVLNWTNLPAFGWTNIQLTLPATRFSELLEFSFLNNPSFFGFDDVTLTSAVLVSNGGFELGNFSGWSSSGNSGKDNVESSPRRSGSFGAQFGASGLPGYISQTVTTYPGQPYLVSLWLDSPDGQTPNEFTASWGGQTLTDMVNLPAFGWTNLHFVVMNTNLQNILQFGLRDDPTSLSLDEVSVYPIPLVQNGDFEFGDLTGWTTSGNFQDSSITTQSTYVNSGFYGGQFGPVTNLGYLSQTIQTIPGQSYLVAFELSNPAATNGTEFTASWDGALLADFTNLYVSGWLPYNFLVTATATTTELKFGFRNDPDWLGFDAVSVSPIAAPVFQSIQKSGSLVNLTWSVLPGYEYALQYKTNLYQSNWTTLVNFAFPTNYTMSATDTNPPGASRFYRVWMAPPPLIF